MSSVSDDDVIESANVQYLAAVGRTVKDPVHDYSKCQAMMALDTRVKGTLSECSQTSSKVVGFRGYVIMIILPTWKAVGC
jgi:hypothetical protein